MLDLARALMQKVDPAAAAPPTRWASTWRSGKAGILTGDKEPATLERLKSQIARAKTSWSITPNRRRLTPGCRIPRYAKFDYAPEYAIAELTLSRALIRAGGYKTAERYLLRVLGAERSRRRSRPPTAPWSTSRWRRAGSGDPGRAGILRQGLRRARRDPAQGQREGIHLPGSQGRLRGRRHRAPDHCSPPSTASRASTRPRCISGLIHARRGLSRRRGGRCARSSSRSIRIDSRSSSTAATTASRIATCPGAHRARAEKYDDAYYFTSASRTTRTPARRAVRGVVVDVQAGEYEAANAFLEVRSVVRQDAARPTSCCCTR